MTEAVKSAVDVRDRRTVLIVEDDVVQRMVLRFEIEKNGFIVQEAGDGWAGLAAIGNFHPDIIITDLMMPVMDGFSFIDAVRKTDGLSTVPIIAISAVRGTGMGERAIESGANQFCEKPVSAKIIMVAIESYLPARS